MDGSLDLTITDANIVITSLQASTRKMQHDSIKNYNFIEACDIKWIIGYIGHIIHSVTAAVADIDITWA